MASKKNRSSWAKEKAQFNAQLGGFDALDDVDVYKRQVRRRNSL